MSFPIYFHLVTLEIDQSCTLNGNNTLSYLFCVHYAYCKQYLVLFLPFLSFTEIHVQVNTSVYSLIKSIMEFNNNSYSAAFIGPCNALGLGEFEETIRPCSFTIGSEKQKYF